MLLMAEIRILLVVPLPYFHMDIIVNILTSSFLVSFILIHIFTIYTKNKFIVVNLRWLDSIIKSMDVSLSKLQEIVKDGDVRCATIHGVSKSWTWLSNWITTTKANLYLFQQSIDKDVPFISKISISVRINWP